MHVVGLKLPADCLFGGCWLYSTCPVVNGSRNTHCIICTYLLGLEDAVIGAFTSGTMLDAVEPWPIFRDASIACCIRRAHRTRQFAVATCTVWGVLPKPCIPGSRVEHAAFSNCSGEASAAMNDLYSLQMRILTPHAALYAVFYILMFYMLRFRRS